MDILVVAFGFGVGVLIGLTGVGGGSLMTPLLVLFAGVKPTIAIGTDLAYGAITKTVDCWRQPWPLPQKPASPYRPVWS